MNLHRRAFLQGIVGAAIAVPALRLPAKCLSPTPPFVLCNLTVIGYPPGPGPCIMDPRIAVEVDVSIAQLGTLVDYMDRGVFEFDYQGAFFRIDGYRTTIEWVKGRLPIAGFAGRLVS